MVDGNMKSNCPQSASLTVHASSVQVIIKKNTEKRKKVLKLIMMAQ